MRDEAAATVVATKPAPFLTEEQRNALDQALKEKAQEQAKARAAANHKAAAASGERKSRSAKGPGGAKKGGGGGKWTWGTLLSTAGSGDSPALDRNDPNYDSEEELVGGKARGGAAGGVAYVRSVAAEVTAYKEAVKSLVDEYFAGGSIADVADGLEDLGGAGHLAHYFVKRLVTAALDRHDREREMASTLLSSLYAEVVAPEQVYKGFAALLSSVEDLVLDVPAAPELLARFTCRAVVDDVLPPAAVNAIDASAGPASKDLRQRVEAQLAARHGAEKVLRCWGGAGSGLSYGDTKASIAALLAEYLAARDADEAARRLHELALPFFHHELVKQALMAAIENPAQTDAVVALLARLTASVEVSASQLAKGLRRVADSLADAVLDCPQAGERFAALAAALRSAGVLSELDADDVGANAAAVLFEAAPGAASGPASASASSANGAATPGGKGAQWPVSMPPGVAAFKAAALAAVREYFDSQDAAEVAERLLSLAEPGLHPLFVKAAVSLALDRRDRERELTAKLLVALVPQVISRESLAGGFTRLLAAADDLSLDVPDAAQLLALFTGRAIVDELLPPAFLTQVLPSLDAGGLGVAVVRAAGATLSARHGTERLAQCWHGGALGAGGVVDAVREAIQEYGAGGGSAEVARLLRELDAPAVGQEAVAAAVELAFSRYGHAEEGQGQPANGGDAADPLAAAAAPVAALLRDLAGQGALTASQLAAGFERVRGNLEEEVLDYGPAARSVLEWLSARGREEGWLA